MANKKKTPEKEQIKEDVKSVSSKKATTKVDSSKSKASKLKQESKPVSKSEVKEKSSEKTKKVSEPKSSSKKADEKLKKVKVSEAVEKTLKTSQSAKTKPEPEVKAIEEPIPEIKKGKKKSTVKAIETIESIVKETESVETKPEPEVKAIEESLPEIKKGKKKSEKVEKVSKPTVDLPKKEEDTKTTELQEQKEETQIAKPSKPKPTVRYSDEDLEMFKSKILEVRKEAIEELGMLKERLEDLTNYDFAEESMIYSMHMAEQGSEAMEKEKTYAQIQRINEYIKKLDEALQRIADKTYGICRECGILIAKERLLAVPITTLSASWKIRKVCPEDGIDRIEPLK